LKLAKSIIFAEICLMYFNNKVIFHIFRDVVMVVILCMLHLSLPIQSVYIATNVVISNPAPAKWDQHYVIKFVSDLWKVCCFLRVLRFSPPIKLPAKIKLSNGVFTLSLEYTPYGKKKNWILLKVELGHDIYLNPSITMENIHIENKLWSTVIFLSLI
jgi:hypothetical protein